MALGGLIWMVSRSLTPGAWNVALSAGRHQQHRLGSGYDSAVPYVDSQITGRPGCYGGGAIEYPDPR